MKLVLTHDKHGKEQVEVLGRNAALKLLLEKSDSPSRKPRPVALLPQTGLGGERGLVR